MENVFHEVYSVLDMKHGQLKDACHDQAETKKSTSNSAISHPNWYVIIFYSNIN